MSSAGSRLTNRSDPKMVCVPRSMSPCRACTSTRCVQPHAGRERSRIPAFGVRNPAVLRAMRCRLALVGATLALLACTQPAGRAPASPVQGTMPPDTHNSRNSLDWPGTYEGVGPCADCPGIVMSLTLDQDGSYTLISRYIDRPAPPRVNHGTFTWQASGNAITLNAGGGGARYAVREGSLAALPRDGGAPSSPPSYVLKQVPRAAADMLAPTLH